MDAVSERHTVTGHVRMLQLDQLLAQIVRHHVICIKLQHLLGLNDLQGVVALDTEGIKVALRHFDVGE